MRTQRSLFPYRQSFIKLHSESHACTASILPWIDLEIRWNSEQAQTKRDLTRQSVYLVFIISAPSILSWPKWSWVNGWSWASLWKGKDLQVWFLDQLNDLPQYCTRKLLLQTLEWNCLEDFIWILLLEIAVRNGQVCNRTAIYANLCPMQHNIYLYRPFFGHSVIRNWDRELRGHFLQRFLYITIYVLWFHLSWHPADILGPYLAPSSPFPSADWSLIPGKMSGIGWFGEAGLKRATLLTLP